MNGKKTIPHAVLLHIVGFLYARCSLYSSKTHLTSLRSEKKTASKQRESNYFLYHILVILVCLIFFCSWKIPYMSASLVGGHPGT
jgi:hypothetical protein